MTILRLFFLFILLINLFSSRKCANCENRFKSDKYSIQNGNGGFYLYFTDEHGNQVERFQPGKIHRILVKNDMIGVKFHTFQLKVFPTEKVKRNESLGTFKYPKFITEDPQCPGVFSNNNKHLVSKVHINWIAPQYPEQCINLQATVAMDSNLVYQNSHNLQKTVCSNEMFTFINDKPIVNNGMKTAYKQCCACGTASYRVTFHGLWNKTTHPKEWPEEKGQLHWTDPIGVTHNHNYFIYHLGGQASFAVGSVCTTGNSRSLKEEFTLPENRLNVKSLFTSGWLNGEEQLNEERSGFISVNRTHNLFSMISMMGPSPDWCTGVSGIDLCMEGCKWKSNLTIPLFPFDAGIQTGETYKPESITRLDEPEPIKEISKIWMKSSPFTPNVPVAELILTRISPKTDEKCSKSPMKNVDEFNKSNELIKQNYRGKNKGIAKYNVLDDPQLAQMAKAFCGFSQWASWSRCSVDCGVGESSRKRELIKNFKNELCVQLPRKETRYCYGRRRNCDFSMKCSLLPWTEWTKCTATCKEAGKIARSRRFVREAEREECLREVTPTTRLYEEKPCKLDQTDSRCDPVSICSAGKLPPCTRGKRQTRYFYHVKTGKCEPFFYFNFCQIGLNNFRTEVDCEKMCVKAIGQLPGIKRSNLALLQFRTSYSGDLSQKETKIPAQCFNEIESVKTCIHKSPRTVWYYSHRNQKCRSLVDFGCQGSLNKFSSFEQCMKICRPNLQSRSSTSDKVDCQVSNWSSWRPCSKSCGKGTQIRKRIIYKDSLNGGEPCPLLYDSRDCYGISCN